MSDDLISLLSRNYPSTSVAGKNANGFALERRGGKRLKRNNAERINHFSGASSPPVYTFESDERRSREKSRKRFMCSFVLKARYQL